MILLPWHQNLLHHLGDSSKESTYWFSSCNVEQKRTRLHFHPPTFLFTFVRAVGLWLMLVFLTCSYPKLKFVLKICVFTSVTCGLVVALGWIFYYANFLFGELWDQLDRAPRFLLLEVKDTSNNWKIVLLYPNSCSKQQCHHLYSIIYFDQSLGCSPIFSEEFWFHISKAVKIHPWYLSFCGFNVLTARNHIMMNIMFESTIRNPILRTSMTSCSDL